MQVAVLADVHGNLPALQAVLKDVDRAASEEVWCAGDLVGYNPWPTEVLEVLRGRKVRAIRGNHDRAVLSGDTSSFNEAASAAVRWTRIVIAPWAVGYLKGLEDRARGSLADAVVAMYHGSPRDDDEYVFPWAAHEELLALARADVVLLGHTHLPFVFRSGARLVANPGSVGQPRDGDPRASWGLLDTARRTFELRRVAYDIDAVANGIRRAGLPPPLADRLYAGV